MKLSRPDLAALVLAGVLGLAIAVLAGLHVQSPDVLAFLATAALSAGAGVAIPSYRQSTPAAADPPARPAAPVPIPAPAPAPALEGAAPVATHAP